MQPKQFIHLYRDSDAILSTVPPLFQYTKPGGLLGILSSNALRFTHVQYQNDSQEFHCGIDIFKKVLKKEYDLDAGIYLIQLLEEGNLYPVYTCSLTAENDLLSQWRGYCPTGGYAYSIRKEQLYSIISPNDLALAECLYEYEDQKKFIIEKIMQVTPEAYYRGIDGSGPKTHLNMGHLGQTMGFKIIGRNLLNYGSVLKDKSFKEEAEWRLIAIHPYEKQSFGPGYGVLPPARYDHVKFREGSKTLVPYIEISLVKNRAGNFINDEYQTVAFDEIIVGPNPEAKLAVSACQLLVKGQAGNPCNVRSSDIPYKNW